MLYHSCPALLILLLKVFLKIVTNMQNFNLPIPHLQKGQSVKSWRILYTAATPGLSEEQQRTLLPVVVDRSTTDKAWACKAAGKTTLKEALDDLQARLDCKLTRLDAAQKFFELKPAAAVSLENLSEYFFQVLEAGSIASVAYDLIALKFLQPIPGATKLFSENEAELKENMSEEQVIAIFDKVKRRLQEKDRGKAEKKEESFMAEGLEKVPKWAEDLREDIMGLQKTLQGGRMKMVPEASDSLSHESKAVFYNSRKRKSKKKKQKLKDQPDHEDSISNR